MRLDAGLGTDPCLCAEVGPAIFEDIGMAMAQNVSGFTRTGIEGGWATKGHSCLGGGMERPAVCQGK